MCYLLDKGICTTGYQSGGSQRAPQSMINRRFMIVLRASPRGGHTEQPDVQTKVFRT